MVFDAAMHSLERDVRIDSNFYTFTVRVQTVKCGEDKLLFDDYDNVKAFLKSPIREIHQFRGL